MTPLQALHCVGSPVMEFGFRDDPYDLARIGVSFSGGRKSREKEKEGSEKKEEK